MSKKLSEKKWWHTIALASAVIATLPLTSYAQDTGDEDLEELETFTMVGSRIKRIDAEPINPVISKSVVDMEKSGYSSLNEAVKSLSFNTGGSLSDDSSSGSYGYGAHTVNFRGLGTSNVLMLVNGRRVAPYGVTAYMDSVFDLDSIPTAAIESYEILKDGGSAIYGSDAVSGVINVKLRKDYEGMNTKLRVGNFEGTDGGLIEGSVTMGTSSAKTSILVTASYHKENSVYARDVDWQINSADMRGYKNSYQNVYDYFAAYGYDQSWLSDKVNVANYYADAYTDARSSRGMPATVALPNGVRFTYDQETSNPTIDDAVVVDPYGYGEDGERHGFYDYAEDYGYLPSSESYSFYTSVRRDLTDHLYAFLEISYKTSEIEYASAPAPVTTSDDGAAADGTIYVPDYNPYNPTGQDLTVLGMRLRQMGNRDVVQTSNTPRYLIGLGGDFLSDWSWEAGALWSKSDVDVNSLSAYDDRVQEAFMGVDLLNETTGTVETMYLNPFGRSNQEVYDYISGWNLNNSYKEVHNYDLSASGSLLELPAGKLALAVGTEYREERFHDGASLENETGNIIGGSTYTSSDGYRNVFSAYVELDVPITKWMEAQLATRYEDYSDFGDTTKPKVAVKIRPLDSVSIRASYGQSFRAPDLAYLYTSSKVSFGGTADDPLTNRPITEIERHAGGNVNLQPEETDTYYVGVTWEPSGFLKGFYASVDYIQMETSDLITIFSYADMLDSEANALYYTQTGNIVRRAPAPGQTYGDVAYVNEYYENNGESTYKGVDFSLGYDWDTEHYGSFGVSADATWMATYEIIEAGEPESQVGREYYPDWVGNLNANWSYGDWDVAATLHYIDSRDSLTDEDEPRVNGLTVFDSQVQVSSSVTYRGFEYFDVSLGVQNLFDKEPPFSLMDSYGTSTGLVYTRPRFWTLTLSRNW